MQNNEAKPARLCRDCRWFYADDRSTVYRRPPCYFCRRKGPFFSRSWRIGEGTRIGYDDPACPDFSPKPSPTE